MTHKIINAVLVLLVVATVYMAITGIWTGDGRWGWSAFVVGIVTFLFGGGYLTLRSLE